MDDFVLEPVPGDPLAARPVEFVERKGLGHPDTLCDGVAEAVSRALCRAYRERFGRVLHHNVDKVQLVAGAATPAFGGGRVVEHPYLLVGGRAVAAVDGERVPVRDVAERAARDYLDAAFPRADADAWEVEARVGEGSADLRALYGRDDVARANDTSFGVGHAPRSPVERLVRDLEPRLRDLPGVGEDVKVMAVRAPDGLRLVVAAAVVAREVAGMDDYREVVASVRETARDAVGERVDGPVEVAVNAADDPAAGAAGVYLTETGLSAEMGDDGAVGRGNRANGLITPHRPMSLEAVAGKNPVGHVGKLYNLLARRAADRIHERLGADYAEVHLVSRIGEPVADPQTADVRTTVEDEAAVRSIVADELARVEELTEALVEGRVEVF